MAELKTKPTRGSVQAYLKSLPDDGTREDCQTLVKLMSEITGAKPEMWGASVVGFGRYRYTYASGHSGEWFITGFSPRKQNLTLYLMGGTFKEAGDLLENLGKHSTGKGCLYIKRLDDIHIPTLKKLIRQSVRRLTLMAA